MSTEYIHGKVIMEKGRYQELLDAEDQLVCLEDGGVDNWSGYAAAMEPYFEMIENREE